MHSPMRIGIVGTGGIARAHAPAWRRDGIELHAFSVDGGEEFARQTGARLHRSLDDLLGAVDVVDICTPTPAHPEVVRAALAAGRDVICEKPLARTTAQAQELADLAAHAGRRLLPAHVVRWFAPYAAAQQAIADGRIGTPAVLRFERTGTLPRQPWFRDLEASGGIVMDQMIHDLDQALWIAGPAASVYGVESIAEGEASIRTAHVVLEHRSGAISHCRGLWGPDGTAFRYTFSLAGDRGRLEYDSAQGDGVAFDEVASSGGGDAGYIPSFSPGQDPYTAQLTDLLEAIRTGAEARVDAAAGVEVVRIAELALASIAEGRRIPC